ncbi:MAG: IS66 family insertion sequence element accessory protein TnpA [Limisphaerales bacterium]
MENTSSLRPRRTAAQRAQILHDYRQSGLTQKAFAAQAGVGYSTLSSWIRKAAGQSGDAPQFIPVPNLLPGAGAISYRIEFGRGLSVAVASGFQARELSALLQVVQRL